jgi:hypothetical protein
MPISDQNIIFLETRNFFENWQKSPETVTKILAPVDMLNSCFRQ